MEPDDLVPLADQADLAEQDADWSDDSSGEPDDVVVPDPERIEPVDEER